mmetsp:Transcript_123877/g.174718  ORF Transcript_123877/g.174718 Transcript_123877/m.174718 type:complete len:503 (+) Transcript_123877:36-1544(+)
MGCVSSGCAFARIVGDRVHHSGSKRYHRHCALENDYNQSRQVLGRGFSGTVMLGRSVQTEDQVAIKTLRVSLSDIMDGEKAIKHMAREVDVLLSVNHPNIVALVDVYEMPTSITLVMELLQGGTLQSHLLEQERLMEEEAACVTRQMMKAVDYLHCQLITHRDLKPDNFMFAGPGFGEGDLKLIDFGFCKHFTPGKLMKSSKGSLSYMAPEVLQHKYTFTCDIWSLGVIVFRCLSGYLPFQEQLQFHPLTAQHCEDRIKSRILHGKVQLQDKDAWKTLSSPARQFVKSLLSVEPSKRPTARSALNHEWLRHRSASRRLTKMTSMAQSFMAQLRDPGVPGTFARACIMLLMWLICHCGEDEAGTAESPAARGDLPGAQSEGVHSFAFVRKGLFMSALKDPDRAPRACQQIFSLLRGSGPWAQIFEAMRPFEAEMTGQLLTQAFGILDHDGKGFVTLPNMQDVFGDGGWDVAEMLREVTGSGDEAITYSQFRKHMCVEDDEVVV